MKDLFFKPTSSQLSFYTGSTELDSVLWNQGVVQLFHKQPSYEQLNTAYNKLVFANESLRMKIRNTENGFVLQPCEFQRKEYPFWELLSTEELDKKAKDFLNEPLDFDDDLVKCVIFKTPEASGIMISGHHMFVDGYSVTVMTEHINNYLKNPNYTPPAYQHYEDYVSKEEKHKYTKRYVQDYNFWSHEFEPLPDCSVFGKNIVPTDYFSSEINRSINSPLFKKIKLYCEKADISVQTFFNTVYASYFYRTANLTRFTLGVPVLNRTTMAEFNTIGLYMHIVPLIIDIDDSSFFCNCLKIENSQMNLFRHQKFTQSDIKKMLAEKNVFPNRIFDVATDYQDFKLESDYDIKLPYSNHLSLPLEIHMQSFGGEKHNLKIRYRTSMFTEQEIHTMINSIIAIAEDAIANPEKKINELEMLLPDEKQKVLYEFNNTHTEYAKDKCIHELFEEQAEKTPEKVAVIAGDKTLTYKELNEEANRVAHSLMEKGVGKGDIVGLLLPRKSIFLSALFGVLKTGAAYLPLDPDHPEERNKSILVDSNAKLCISDENFYELLENSVAENPDNVALPDNLCYCIYTSGSTGTPKGTLLYHRNLVWYISVLKSIYGTENINMPFFTSQSVDLTVPSIFFPLITGGTVYMYNGELKNDLVKIFDNENLSILKFTPTHIGIVNDIVPEKSCPNIRYVIVGGESFHKDTCVRFLDKFGKHIEIHNEYGPTEATVSCTDYIISPYENTDGTYFSIGSPVNNAQIYITDNFLKPLPIGTTGELCIAGDGVGAGYLNNTELTDERFIDNPFGEGKLYKTGDLAYWREDGNIVFVGRKDFQVKIRGLRIELGEIESAVSEVDGIIMSAAVVRNDAQNRQFICVFYTGEKKETSQFRQMLGEKLPKYMIPHVFAHLEEMPLTVSGKVDRNALPEIELEIISTEAEHIAPETPKEKALSEAVCSVMNLDSISIQENFFNAGGDSIKAIYIVSELEKQGYELHVADIMQSDTLADIAKAMKSVSVKAVYDQGEVNGFIPFTPIMRTYIKENGTVSDNFVHTCTVAIDCDEETAVKALNVLVSHHDILRGTICEDGIMVHPLKDREVYSYEHITVDDAEDLKKHIEEKELNEKLVHITFCNSEEGKYISISIHHFFVDLVSWEILIKDFKTVVEQLENNETIFLPAKTASFKLWNEELQKYAESISEESKSYWKSVNEKLDDVKVFSSAEADSKKAEKTSFILDKRLTEKLLNDANYKYGTKTNEVLITALGLAVAEMAGGSVGIITEGHGRGELNKPIALDRTVGWFTVCYPIVVDNNPNITDELVNIKETLRKIPRNGIDYLLLSRDFHKNAEIKFNFYQIDNDDEKEKNRYAGFNFNGSVFCNKINVDCSVSSGILSVSISIPDGKYELGFAQRLGRVFKEHIEKLVAVCTEDDIIIKTCSDFSDDELTEPELNELMDLFE